MRVAFKIGQCIAELLTIEDILQPVSGGEIVNCFLGDGTRNSSEDEIANVNFFHDDSIHLLQSMKIML